MRRIGLLLLSFAAWPAFAADAPPLTVTAIEATHPQSGQPYRFPSFRGREPAASAINTWLQAIELHSLPGHDGKAAFEPVWPAKDQVVGLGRIDFTAGERNARFVAVQVTGETTQAYSTDFEHDYSFDATTGAPILLRDLFTPAGLQHVRMLAAKKRVDTVREFLKQIAKQKDEDSADRQSLYEECLPEIRKDNLDGNEFALAATTLTLAREHCANHALLVLDDLGLLPVTLPLNDLAADFSSYGRCLAGLLPATPPCAKPHDGGLESGIYRGTIGKAAVTLVIGRLLGSHILDLGYFYDQHATWIELSGEQRPDGAYWFHETAGAGSAGVDARIVLRTDSAGRLVGNWSSSKGKSLPASLTPLR